MHDIHKWTADALPELLAEMRSGGYKVLQLKPKAAVQLIADVRFRISALQPSAKFEDRGALQNVDQTGGITTAEGRAVSANKAIKWRLSR